MIWFLCLLLLSTLILWSGYRFGPHMALGITTLVSLLFPSWIRVEPYGIEIHLNVAVGVACLGYYLVHPKSVFRAKLILLDYVMIAIVIVNAISDVINSGWQPYILLQIYGEWFVAYVVGRLSLSEFNNVRELLFLGASVSLTLAILSIIESYSYSSIFQSVFGVSEIGVNGIGFRWGFRRASGPLNHPIYFGTLLFLLSPWVIQYISTKYQESKNGAWFAAGVLIVAGILGTVSRAPALALSFLVAGPLFIFVNRARLPMVIAGVLMIGVFYVGQSQVVEILDKAVQAQPNERNKMVVDGENVIPSSASARIYLLKYYRSAVRRAGLFGYGSVATAQFPPNVPSGGNMDMKAMKGLKWIDNQYLLFTLRFGYLGVACWITALACSAWNFYYSANRGPIDLKWFCACNASVIVGLMFIQTTVWMPQDYGFYLIWLMGGSAGLVSHLQIKKRQKEELSR